MAVWRVKTKRRMKMWPIPKCPDERGDCFASAYGSCAVLTDTRFEGLCPFYKSKEQYEKEAQIYGSVPDLIQKKDPPSEDGESIK